jgi:zinc/manganese transport system substrate-binding protein
MLKKSLACGLAILSIGLANATPIKIVAAENFYGELATEIGGKNVEVQSIITNPDADPHLFTTSPSISKALSSAQIIIYNGADYDPWMEQLLKSINNKNVIVINVANLMGIKSGANPHIWYKLDTFPTLARELTKQIKSINPKVQVDLNLKQFLKENQQIAVKANSIKVKHNGVSVTATEPVFGYMASEMGLSMQGIDFQWKIMNDTEPSPQMLASYEALLKDHKVSILFYNKQVTDSTTKNILKLAQDNKIQIVGVTETMPKNTKINKWLLDEINDTNNALKAK